MKKYFLILVLVIATACTTTASERMNDSPHYKDGEFQNTHSFPHKSFWKFLKMRWSERWADWPSWREIESSEAPLKVMAGVRVTFINHATVLIQSQGWNVLTDPHYSKRCSPVQFAGPARIHRPGVDFEHLPKIDVILISHDHYDHLDLNTIERLVKRDNPQIFVGLGVKQRISSKANVVEMDWWNSFELAPDFEVHFVEVQHFSGRTLFDQNTTLWGGFVLKIGKRHIYFGGDSGYGDHYKRTFKKFGAMDISLLPIGAYAPYWFMGPMHMNPEDAVQAHLDLKSQISIGIHYGTFQLTAEPVDEPLERLKNAKSKMNVGPKDFITLKPGRYLEL